MNLVAAEWTSTKPGELPSAARCDCTRPTSTSTAPASVFREKPYPWQSPQDDLAAAVEKLIRDCGYHRRDRELTDAKKPILAF